MFQTLHRTSEIVFTLSTSTSSPEKFRMALEKLGPTFVKFGQLLSSRPDLFPLAYTEELRKLLDHESPLPYETIKTVIESELDKPISELFLEFDQTPISSASIGQVHKATLNSKKTKVAVKVQRPNIRAQIFEDIKILKSASQLLEHTSFFKGTGLKQLVAEFSSWIQAELDFVEEGNRAKKLAKNLEDTASTVVPDVFDTLTTEKVLTTSFQAGLTVNEILNTMHLEHASSPENLKFNFPINFEKMVPLMINVYIFKQILTDGYFHGDPHPANIIVLPKNTLAFVDFGIMGVLNQEEHRQALMFILSVVEDNPTTMARTFASISEKTLTRKEELEFVDAISEELHKIHTSSLKSATLGEMSLHIVSIGKKYGLHWSPGVIDVLRAITLLEGIALRLLPEKSMIDLIKPHLKHFLATEALHKLKEEELYKNVLSLMETGDHLSDLGNIIGDHGIKVETTNTKGGE